MVLLQLDPRVVLVRCVSKRSCHLPEVLAAKSHKGVAHLECLDHLVRNKLTETGVHDVQLHLLLLQRISELSGLGLAPVPRRLLLVEEPQRRHCSLAVPRRVGWNAWTPSVGHLSVVPLLHPRRVEAALLEQLPEHPVATRARRGHEGVQIPRFGAEQVPDAFELTGDLLHRGSNHLEVLLQRCGYLASTLPGALLDNAHSPQHHSRLHRVEEHQDSAVGGRLQHAREAKVRKVPRG
mmetsp:Transcript_12124/g.35083  ORF Transcript_12124/g.35083 Transcript_12124/m.35083 type:complete len:237 (+) Transcript_12124:508-1218(+)